MLRTPNKFTCFLGERPETSCNGCQVRNKTTQELDHPKERLEICKTGGGVHRQYGIDLPWIGLKTVSTDDMAKEGNSSAPEFTFIQIEAKTSLASTLKNSTKVFVMIAKITVVAVDYNVIRNSSDTR